MWLYPRQPLSKEDTFQVQSSHTLDRLDIGFTAKGLVANAGLALPATLAQHLGLAELLRQHVRLGQVKNSAGANPDLKAMTVIASALAGGEYIDDINALRAGETDQVLGFGPMAASTTGSFLRAFTAGHARQLDAVQEDLLSRAWAAGAGPGKEAEEIKLDLDSTVIETFGLQKQGGKDFTYKKGQRGYHPLLAVLAEGGEVIHSRLRQGKANTGRGAGSFARQALARLRRAGQGRGLKVVVRTDSGFYSKNTVDACEAHGARFSISIRLQESHRKLIEAIPKAKWVPIPYWKEGAASVAEIPYAPFGRKKTYRMIVRRVEMIAGGQMILPGTYLHLAFLTDREGDMLALEGDHRQHAVVEDAIKELKYGVGLNHLPSGKFGANAAWLALNVIAYNLARWLPRLAGWVALCVKTLRHRFLAMPGRLARSGRRLRLHLPVNWPWEQEFNAALAKLRAISLPAVT